MTTRVPHKMHPSCIDSSRCLLQQSCMLPSARYGHPYKMYHATEDDSGSLHVQEAICAAVTGVPSNPSIKSTTYRGPAVSRGVSGKGKPVNTPTLSCWWVDLSSTVYSYEASSSAHRWNWADACNDTACVSLNKAKRGWSVGWNDVHIHVSNRGIALPRACKWVLLSQ